jgi:ADP-ribosyl-[dinitrogen reductase] hydrolase
MTTLQDRAFGCMFGAFVGDSIGSFLEYFQGEITDAKVDEALKMLGGGVWYLAPGQVTEDSELSMMLMNGLIEGKGKLDPDRLCYQYGVWYDYGPFAQKRINQVKLKTHDWWDNKTPA